MPLALRARALWKCYAAGVAGCSARIWVLRGVSLDVEQGEYVAVLGAPGAGVSTLLLCLAGLRRIDAGAVQWTAPPVYCTTGERELEADASSPGLLLCDERASERQRPAREHLQPVTRRGAATIIVAARSLAAVRPVADRVLLLRDGRLDPLDPRAGVRRVAERTSRPLAPSVASACTPVPPPVVFDVPLTSGTRAPARPGTVRA